MTTDFMEYRERLAGPLADYLSITPDGDAPATVRIMRLIDEAARALVSGAGTYTIARGFYDRVAEVLGDTLFYFMFGDRPRLEVVDDLAEIIEDARNVRAGRYGANPQGLRDGQGGTDRAEDVREVLGVPPFRARSRGRPDLFGI